MKYNKVADTWMHADRIEARRVFAKNDPMTSWIGIFYDGRNFYDRNGNTKRVVREAWKRQYKIYASWNGVEI